MLPIIIIGKINQKLCVGSVVKWVIVNIIVDMVVELKRKITNKVLVVVLTLLPLRMSNLIMRISDPSVACKVSTKVKMANRILFIIAIPLFK